ncbi:hypothetical protein KIW84_062906 [Lathyrus oleraceus]|uniref:DUF7745 domain-containing protein n=1 Tax=Pisum sativum TaxID=3888 RepID=A0A9D4W725_PEA|nr:hypothetical protein KIW84_062906 [Pisum sativum]
MESNMRKTLQIKINLKVRGDFRGFPKDCLEKKVVNFATSNNWDSLDTMMVLLIFGLILFPSEEFFLDLIAVNVFLAVKIGDEDPTSALLADVYYTLHQRHSPKTHKRELDKDWLQSKKWKEIWMSSTNTQREMKEGFEARIQGLVAEVRSLVTSLREVKAQSLDEQLRRMEAERLLSIRASKWR